MTIDASTLAKICTQCFVLAGNGDLPEKERHEFLLLGKELRGDLLNLVTASFTEDTHAVKEANKELKSVNKALEAFEEDLKNAVETVQKIAAVAKTLDSLMKLASGFV